MDTLDFNTPTTNTGGNLKFATIIIWLSNRLFQDMVQGQVIIKVLTDYGAFFLMTVTVLGYIYKNWIHPLIKKK